MDRYTIKSRDKKTNTIILENVKTHELTSVNEGLFKDAYARVKDVAVKLYNTAKGVVAKIGNKIITSFVHPDDIAKNHSDRAAFYSTDESLNDGSFDEYLENICSQEVENLKELVAKMFIVATNFFLKDAELQAVKTNESIATRRPKSWNSGEEGSNIWDAMSQVYGDLRDVQATDDEGNPLEDKNGNPVMVEKKEDTEIFNIMRAAAIDYIARSNKDSKGANVEEGEVDGYVKNAYDILATNGKLDNFGAAVNAIARFINIRFTAPYKKGAEGLSGDDPTAFGWRMLYGVPGIGKSAMMGRIKEMAKEGYFSKDKKTPNAYYSSSTDTEISYDDLVMIPITCENADESMLQLPAREDAFSYRLVNPETHSKYTDAEVIEKMKEIYGKEWEVMQKTNGLGVFWNSAESDEWNKKNATDYLVGERITSKPACDIPLIKATAWSEELDKMFPPTIVFLDEVYMAKPSGLFAIKSLVDKRQLGEFVVPSKVVFIGTSNRPEDFGANEKKVIKSIQEGPTTERTTNIYFAPTFTEFIEYASKINPKTNMPTLHPMIIEFLEMVEHRFRFANMFSISDKQSGDRTRTIQRGWSQFSRELYEIISQYEGDIISGTIDEKNAAIDDMLNDIKKAATSNMLYSDGVAFTDFARGQYRGVPGDFYKKMWKGDITKDKMVDSSGQHYSSDFKYIEKQEQVRGNKTVTIDIPHHIHISTQTFAEKAYQAFPFKKNGGPSAEDLMPDAEGKIPMIEFFNNAYKVMYKEGFIVGNDKSYIQKLANYFSSNYSKVLSELGMPESLNNNERAKKAYMLGTITLPKVTDELDKIGKKIQRPEFYTQLVKECGAVAAIDKTRVIE